MFAAASLMPAAAIALAAVLLHERLTVIQVVGALLAMGGVWLVRRGAGGQQPPAPRVRPLTGA